MATGLGKLGIFAGFRTVELSRGRWGGSWSCPHGRVWGGSPMWPRSDRGISMSPCQESEDFFAGFGWIFARFREILPLGGFSGR